MNRYAGGFVGGFINRHVKVVLLNTSIVRKFVDRKARDFFQADS
jgi:hypothetical protein